MAAPPLAPPAQRDVDEKNRRSQDARRRAVQRGATSAIIASISAMFAYDLGDVFYTLITRDVGQATHGFDGSLRFLGFDPIRGIPSAVTSLGEYGFKPPTPITVADGLMLVVVDTSGLHYRGYARPGELNVNLLVWPERAGPWGRRDLGLSFAVISAMIRHKLGDYYRRSRRIYASQASSAWRRGWRARAAAAAAACRARTRTCARRLWTNAELSYYCEAASSD